MLFCNSCTVIMERVGKGRGLRKHMPWTIALACSSDRKCQEIDMKLHALQGIRQDTNIHLCDCFEPLGRKSAVHRYLAVRQKPSRVAASTKSILAKTNTECRPQQTVRAVAIAAVTAVSAAFLLVAFSPAQALTDSSRSFGLENHKRRITEVWDEAATFKNSRVRQTPAVNAQSGQLAGRSIGEQVTAVRAATQRAKEAAENGDFDQALQVYTGITKQFPDLAITNYARISRALLLYQTGSKSQALLELEDLEAALRGYAEVHAALASMVYCERPAEIGYAEEQFDLASEFDRRFSDVNWVKREKQWPPAVLDALDRFTNLRR